MRCDRRGHQILTGGLLAGSEVTESNATSSGRESGRRERWCSQCGSATKCAIVNSSKLRARSECNGTRSRTSCSEEAGNDRERAGTLTLHVTRV